MTPVSPMGVMPLLLRVVAATAAASLILTIWLILQLVIPRGIQPLLDTGPLGFLTLAGWAVTLLVGPVAAVQLWRLRRSGRIAALVVFGFGLLYYTVGLIWLRAPQALTGEIGVAMVAHAVPVAILALPAARRACR